MKKLQEEKERTIQDVINKRKQHTRKVDNKLILKAYRLCDQKTW